MVPTLLTRYLPQYPTYLIGPYIFSYIYAETDSTIIVVLTIGSKRLTPYIILERYCIEEWQRYNANLTELTTTS